MPLQIDFPDGLTAMKNYKRVLKESNAITEEPPLKPYMN